MTSFSMNSFSMIINEINPYTSQVPELPVFHEKLLITLLQSGGIPDDMYDCRKVTSIKNSDGVFEIFYNDEVNMPLVRTINGSWFYVGDSSTTIYDILCYFGYPESVIRSAVDFRGNSLVPHIDMISNLVSSSPYLILDESDSIDYGILVCGCCDMCVCE